MKKFISGLIVGIVVTLIFTVSFNKNEIAVSDSNAERWKRIAPVLSDGFDEYGLFSFQANTYDSIIYIAMDENKSELQLKEYLKKNVDKSDLKHFKLDIEKRNAQKEETGYFMNVVSRIVWDYITEKDYQDVSIQHPIIEPEPLLTITIPENSELSNEVLKKELEGLLVTKKSELPRKEISYKIQVIKG